jgi:acylphosphatase
MPKAGQEPDVVLWSSGIDWEAEMESAKGTAYASNLRELLLIEGTSELVVEYMRLRRVILRASEKDQKKKEQEQEQGLIQVQRDGEVEDLVRGLDKKTAEFIASLEPLKQPRKSASEEGVGTVAAQMKVKAKEDQERGSASSNPDEIALIVAPDHGEATSLAIANASSASCAASIGAGHEWPSSARIVMRVGWCDESFLTKGEVFDATVDGSCCCCSRSEIELYCIYVLMLWPRFIAVGTLLWRD